MIKCLFTLMMFFSFSIISGALEVDIGSEIRGSYVRVEGIDLKVKFIYIDDQVVYSSNYDYMYFNNYVKDYDDVEYINKLMYYGYNYENHTAQKWYFITQYLIWDYFYDVNFIDSSGDIVIKYEDEINELLELVLNDSLNPIFDSDVLEYNEKNILIDTNNVLNNFNASNGIIDDNELIIETNIEDIILKSNYNNYVEEANMFSNGDNYIYVPGKLDEREIVYNFSLLVGKLNINYVKDEVICLECSDGIDYSLYKNNNKIMDFNSNEVFEILLSPGDYIIKEKSRDIGFLRNDEVVEFEIVDGLDTEIELDIKFITNEIALNKYNDDVVDTVSIFSILDDEFNELSRMELSESDVCILGYGDYIIRHVSNEGFSLVDDYLVKVRTDGLVKSKKLISEKLVVIPDTYKSQDYTILYLFLIFGVILGRKMIKKQKI